MRLIDADALIEKMKDCGFSTAQELMANAFCFAALKSESLAPTIGGWISVKDRLPEQYEKTFRGIWAYNGEEIVKTRIVSDNMLVSYLDERGRRKIGISYMLDGEWSGMVRGRDGIDVFTKAITHWMPLPEMPKEEES